MLLDPNIEHLTVRLPKLQKLHQQLSTDKKFNHLNSQDIANILNPERRYDSQPIYKTLSEITDERVTMYLKLISLQYSLSKVGIARVRALLNIYDFYVSEILGGKDSIAKCDISQQATDISLMYVINHSQLAFLAALIGEKDQRYLAAKMIFNYQEKEYRNFQEQELKKFENHQYQEIIDIDDKQRINYLLQYEMATLDVADYNIALALQTEKLLENWARARYYWSSSLNMARSIDGKLRYAPVEDLRFDQEIQEMYLERCEILLNRAVQSYNVVDIISNKLVFSC